MCCPSQGTDALKVYSRLSQGRGGLVTWPTGGVGIEWKDLEMTVYDLLLSGSVADGLILRTAVDNLYLVPSHPDLVGVQVELYDRAGPEFILKEVLKSILDFEFCIIDCPPALGILTINALTAADSVLIPIQCEYYALEGIEKLLTTIEMVQRRTNPLLEIDGVLLTMFDSRLNLAKEVVRSVKNFFRDKVYNVVIPRNVRIAEAPGFGKTIFEYDRNSSGARAYLLMAQEFLNHGSTR
ncbi:MAG TPA: hypothetical protein EYP24_04355 [bacterium (Candidatus Stahlbacteria)]|nr:hypothetical protein [Candidatus Stahlbacteria bacterium]